MSFALVVVTFPLVAGPALLALLPEFTPSDALAVTTLEYSKATIAQAVAAPDDNVTVTVLAPAVATAILVATYVQSLFAGDASVTLVKRAYVFPLVSVGVLTTMEPPNPQI
jgi:hypothetical protein